MPKPTRPLSITVLVVLILFYAIFVVAWDLVLPFEREYTQGPASAVLGLRVTGWSAQMMHGLQLLVALRLAYGLWTMQTWGWAFALMTAGYVLVSTTVWVAVYQEFHRIGFAILNVVVANILVLCTFPHREKFQ